MRDLLERDLRAVESRDRQAVLDCFAPDGVLIDPHYPQPRMQGHAQIGAGLDWVFAGMASMRFDIVGFFESADGAGAAAEVESHHQLTGGRRIEFTQTFVVQTRDGLITRMQTYLPYGPPGMAGVVLGLQRLRHRLSRRSRGS